MRSERTEKSERPWESVADFFTDMLLTVWESLSGVSGFSLQELLRWWNQASIVKVSTESGHGLDNGDVMWMERKELALCNARG